MTKAVVDSKRCFSIHSRYHYYAIIWASWRLKLTAIRLFVYPFALANFKGNIEACVIVLLWGESPMDSLHKGQVTRKECPCHDVIMHSSFPAWSIALLIKSLHCTPMATCYWLPHCDNDYKCVECKEKIVTIYKHIELPMIHVFRAANLPIGYSEFGVFSLWSYTISTTQIVFLLLFLLLYLDDPEYNTGRVWDYMPRADLDNYFKHDYSLQYCVGWLKIHNILIKKIISYL